MWEIYLQAKTFAKTPAQILGLDPELELLCFCVNRAYRVYGEFVEAKLSERDDQYRPVNTLADILDGRVTIRGREGTIADLKALAR